jgi:protocatechuate 3,4-dioxygenase beta subunit
MTADTRAGRRSPRALLSVALGLALLLGSIAWLYLSGGEREGVSLAATESAPSGEHAASIESNVSPRSDASARAETTTETAAPAAEPAAKPAEPARVGELRGRVIDSANAPVAAARVRLHRGEARGFSVLDLDVSKATEVIAETSSDARGEFSFELERGMPVDLHVDARGFCPTLASNRHAGEFVEVVVTAGFLCFGRVTRERDGTPIAGSRVRVFKIGGPSSLACETETASDGRYEVRFTFKDGIRLAVVPKLEQCSDWIELTLPPDGKIERDVVLGDGIIVAGKVTELGTGRAIEGAIVGEGWTFQRTATTNANGEYELHGFGNTGINEIAAKAPGFGQTKTEELPGAVDGVIHLDFQLAPARAARGRVVDAKGAPIEGVLAAAIASEMGGKGQRIDWVHGRSDVDGRFRIDNLTHELRHALMLTKRGFATRVYNFPAREFESAELDLGTFELGDPALIAGTVEDENGRGLADVEVVLHGANSDRFRLLAAGEQATDDIGDWYVNSRETHTDSQGRFSFGDVGGGEHYTVHARQRGRPDSAKVAISIAEGEIRDDVVILFALGASLRGRVVDPERRPLKGVYLNALLFDEDRHVGANNANVGARTDTDGKFEFRGLSGGNYRLDAHPYDTEDKGGDAPLLSTVVERVHTDGPELEIVLPRGQSIRGRAVDAQGAALFGYIVVAVQPDGRYAATADTNAAGEWALAVESGSVFDLELNGSPQTDAWKTVFARKASVAAGTRDLVITAP